MIEIVVLAKRLDRAKERLASVFDPQMRRRLALGMLGDLLDVLGRVDRPARAMVVTADREIGALALRAGVSCLHQGTEVGLNPSASVALGHASLHARPLLILPSDIPLARASDVEAVIDAGLLTGGAAVRARDGGTNALFLSAGLPFRFAFGPMSFERHRLEAKRLGMMLTPVLAPGLVDDVDTPASIARIASGSMGPRTSAILVPPLTAQGRLA